MFTYARHFVHVLLVLFLGACGPVCSKRQLILITSADHLGDLNQMRGVARALEKKSTKDVWQVQEVPSTQVESVLTTIANAPATEAFVVLSSGPYGVQALRLLNEKSVRPVVTVHLSHQVLQTTSQLIKTNENPYGCSALVLPGHVLTDELSHTLAASSTIVWPTVGVCHNLTPDEVKEQYKTYVSSLPTARSYLVVILGGDAQMPDGSTWLYYTPEQAQHLASRVVTHARADDQMVLVLNGPRTGKHDPKTGVPDATAHRNGVVDVVTQAFMDEVKKLGLIRVRLLDFQFGQPSLYKAVLGAVLAHPGSAVWVPGESTSMVSETVDVVGSACVHMHDAMNHTHRMHVQSELEAGRVTVLESDGRLIQPVAKKMDAHACSAADTVAQNIRVLLGDK